MKMDPTPCAQCESFREWAKIHKPNCSAFCKKCAEKYFVDVTTNDQCKAVLQEDLCTNTPEWDIFQNKRLNTIKQVDI
jgi:hypothetical protein